MSNNKKYTLLLIVFFIVVVILYTINLDYSPFLTYSLFGCCGLVIIGIMILEYLGFNKKNKK